MAFENQPLWIGLAGAVAYVYERAPAALPKPKRIAQALAAGAMGYAAAVGNIFPAWSPIIVAVCVTALGPFALDSAAALIKDRRAVLEILKARFGK